MKRFCLLVVLLLMVPTSGVFASESGGEKEISTMDEVVVTATKTEEKRKDIANAVVVKDAVDIEEAPVEGVGALLANEPGIDWRTRGNYGGAAEEIHLRGMGADATLVVVDGVVINSPSLGSADVSQIPTNSIERIEVVKGPGSLLYGSGAMGGVVNIINKHPKRSGYTAKAEAGYGTENTYHLAAESGGFVSKDFGYYLTVNRKETDGFRDNSDLTHNDIGLNLLFDKGEPLTLDFNFGFVDRDAGQPGVQPGEGTQPYFINGVEFYNADSAKLLDRNEDKNRHSSLTAKGKATEWADWRVKADCAVLNSTNLNRGFNPQTYSFDGSGTETEVINTVRGLEGNLNLNPLPFLGFLVGSEYRNFKYENKMQDLDTSGAPLAGGLTDEEYHVFSQGTFAEVSVRPVEQVKLLAGLRYEEHSLFGHENVVRYGLVVNPLSDTVIKLSHGKHFKAPTMNDLFWPDDGGSKGNLDLKPETGWYSDFTVEQSLLGNHLFGAISWFKWDIADKIGWAEDTNQPSPTGWGYYWVPSNLNTYRATGWEGSLRIGPYYSLVTDLSLTLLDAEEELSPGIERAARYSPDVQFKAAFSHYADFGLTSTLVTRYVSSRPGYYAAEGDLNPQIELDSYWTVDLKLQQELADHWKVSFLATNLLDEEYDTYLAGFSDQTAFTYTQESYPGAGRSLFMSVAYEF